MDLRRALLPALAAAALAAPAAARPAQPAESAPPAPPAPSTEGWSWSPRPTGTGEQHRGLAAVDRRTAWVSGERGGVRRTTDGGRTWADVSPPTARADGLALRDIEAQDARTAHVLSIGPGAESRILRTSDAGRTWREVFRSSEPEAFYDCLAFSGPVGLAMSDPVDGRFRLQRSVDGGRTWRPLPAASSPAALPGELAFAASGTCLVAAPAAGPHRSPGRFWMVTGGPTPRILRTQDAGRTWTAQRPPVRGGASAGVYGVAAGPGGLGVMVGGDYTAPADGFGAAARSSDGGRTWSRSARPVHGYRSGVDVVGPAGTEVVAVGPNGSDRSVDGGRTWTSFDTAAYDSVRCTRDRTCWASGPRGAVAVLDRR